MCEIPIMCIIGLGSEIITVNQDKSMPSIAQREVGVNVWWDDHLWAQLGRACWDREDFPEEMTSEVTHTLKDKEQLARWEVGKAVESESDP